jgi:uncharacterized protein DUF4389
MSTSPYPVRVAAELDTGLTRWLWLLKWLLAIPHYVVLCFLWAAFVVLSVVAMVAIVVTGRYPRAIFDFNVGVLRWTWRVTYYAYGALGTDRYPPFTLAERPDYPAHLDIDYPEHLSRGLALVKWWLLAIPHYLVVGFFVGGGLWFGNRATEQTWPVVTWGGGLIGLLVLVAAVVLVFTGRYPQNIFDFVLGLNRWVIRVAAYAGLMTDVYPPFRLDLGSDEPGTARWSLGTDTPPPDGPVAARSDLGSPSATDQAPPTPTDQAPSTPTDQAPSGPSTRSTPSSWSAGRVIAVVASCCVLLVSVGVGAAGVALLVANGSLRQDGYLMSGAQTFSSPGYALTTDSVRLERGSGTDVVPQRLLGSVRVTASPRLGSEVFVGIASAADAARYLGTVAHTTVTDVRSPREGGPVYRQSPGGAPSGAPTGRDIWVASAAGPGPRSVEWAPRSGDWVVVVMNADGSRRVSSDVSVGAELPVLHTVALVLLVLAALGLLVGGTGLALSLHRSPRTEGEPGAVH